MKAQLRIDYKHYNAELYQQFGTLLKEKHEHWEEIFFAKIGSTEPIASVCAVALANSTKSICLIRNSLAIKNSLLRLTNAIESLFAKIGSEGYDDIDFVLLSDDKSVNSQ